MRVGGTYIRLWCNSSRPTPKVVRMFPAFVALLLSVSFASPPLVDAAACTAPGSPTYRIVFESLWSATRHGAVNLYPSRAHWSPLVVASHNEDYVMWRVGNVSSAGVKDVAESGDTTALQNELKSTGNVLDFAVAPSSINANEMNRTFTLEFQVDANHSLVSAITMMAPSPDWFVGIRDVDLCNGSVWRTADYLRENFPYDAGTDSGATFTASDNATTPPVSIFLITNETVFAGKTFTNFAQTTVSLISSTTETPSTTNPPLTTAVPSTEAPSTEAPSTLGSSVVYNVVFESMWSESRHPQLFPSNAHWSPLVVASHNSSYYLWRTGELASQGVKDVAERGQTTAIRGELERAKREGTVYDIAIASSDIDAGEKFSLNIMVDEEHPLISVISMMAPSPDWFIGVRDVNMYGNNGWVKTLSRENPPYDAGTDSGFNFKSDNQATSPPVPIFLITSNTGGDVFAGKTFPNFGTTTITLGAGSSASSLAFEAVTTLLLLLITGLFLS